MKLLQRRLCLLVALSLGCAETKPLVIRESSPPPPQLDWEKAGEEAVQVFANYLRVDTRNPPGNETEGTKFLAAILEREGIPSKTFEFDPGRGSIVARLKATKPDGQKPFCMLSHIDVVTAEDGKWPADTPPLSGAIKDGVLWGRGALDMKGLGALELMTLVWLKRLNVPLKRDVVFVAVADEEVHDQGMVFMVDQHWDELGCGHMINEGGIGIRDLLFEGQTVYPISVSEKGLLWLRMTASGPAGHGSTPVPGRAPERLLNAIAKLNAREVKTQVDPSLLTLFRQVGDGKGGLTGYVLARPALINALVMGKLLENPATKAAITNTCQVTGFKGGFEPNVIPSEVSATVDCRLLPGVKPREFLAELRKLIPDEKIQFEVIQEAESNGSPWEDPVFEALARHSIGGRKNVVAGPVLSPGYTDSIYARPKGTIAYGFVPFEVTKEEVATMHGENERVSVENVKRGFKILMGAVAEIAGAD